VTMTSTATAIEINDEVLALETAVRRATPYLHIVSPRFYTEKFAETLLEWLESGAIWRLKETVLFKQYELGFSHFKDCTEIQGLWHPAVLAHLRDAASRAFGVSVSGRINISAHKLVSGQHGSIHTDNEPGETHRLVVQLNRGRASDSGGNLVLLSGPTTDDMAVVFKQASNSAVGFVLGPSSYHAIGRVRTGTRFTIIYTFLSDAATDAKYNYFVAG
jgi:hypothetical protein